MRLHIHWRSSSTSRLCSHFLHSAFLSRFASFNHSFKMRRLSARIKIGLFETLSSVPVLFQWTSAAPMKAFQERHQLQFWINTSWMRTAPACGLQREERCSIRMIHTGNVFAGHFKKLVISDRKALWTTLWAKWLWNCPLGQVALIHFVCNCWRRSAYYWASKLPCVLLYTAVKKRALSNAFQGKRVTNLIFLYLLAMVISNVRKLDQNDAHFCAVLLILFRLTYFLKILYFSYGASD